MGVGCELRYGGWVTMVIESGEWAAIGRRVGRCGFGDLSEADQAKMEEMPDPEPLLNFAGVQRRKPAGGDPEGAGRHRR